MKKVAIMQPYFLPYIGYWQLVQSVDEFVIYDNIEYTKKGWFNRNRLLDADHDRLFTVPIKKDSDFLDVKERYRSDDSDEEIARILRIIQNTYRKAPQFAEAYPAIERCFLAPDRNLFDYIFNSVKEIKEYLGITTNLVVSSTVQIDHSLKAEKKVLAICKAEGADMYINAIGGQELYSKEEFQAEGIELHFIKAGSISYKQYDNPFVPWLSIVDVMMFNDRPTIQRMLEEYSLI